MAPHKPDRRIARTRKALSGALIELAMERGFEAVTVAQIAERANVGRSTFYAHFTSKEDLLAEGIDDLRREIEERQRDRIESEGSHPVLAFSLPMLQHAEENRGLFRAFMGSRSGPLLHSFFHIMLGRLVRTALRGGSAPPGRSWTHPEEAVVETIVGAFQGLIMWWLDGDIQLEPAEVDAIFCAVVRPGLEAWYRPPAQDGGS